MNDDENKVDDIPVVPEPSRQALNSKQIEDYRIHRKQFIKWLKNIGKDPSHGEGYSDDTTRRTAYRVDRFYRWVWDREGGYTTQVTPEPECRTCGRPLSLKEETKTEEKQRVIERLAELEEKGVLEKLNKLEGQI